SPVFTLLHLRPPRSPLFPYTTLFRSFALSVVPEEEGGDESISIDKLTAQGDMSPIIRLVDTTIFTALQRRASDIHIETQDDSVGDRKSTRLNSSHRTISYAVFCLKKK